MRYTLRGARLVDATVDLAGGDLTIEDGHIERVGGTTSNPGRILDVSSAIVVPGFIDVHTHGGGGFVLHTTEVEQLQGYARWVVRTGVTSFLAGVVGTADGLPLAQLRTVVAASGREPGSAELLGIHLEGPYISPQKRGAHVLDWLRRPDPIETEQILAAADGHLRVITIAPELPDAHALLRRMREAGVTVSIGHTMATYEQSMEALALGITHATHCFNAMPPLLHREPGPMAAIIKNPHVRGELIADGVHVHPEVMRLLISMLGPQRTIIVTDAMAGAGLAEGSFCEFAGQQVRISDGAARLGDGILAGSVLTMSQALCSVLEITQLPLSDVIGMFTRNPAQAAQVDGRKGLLHPGYDADLLLLNSNMELQATICYGQIIHTVDS